MILKAEISSTEYMINELTVVSKKRYWLKGLLVGLAMAAVFSIYKAASNVLFQTTCACLGETAVISFWDRVFMFVASFIITAPPAMLLGSGIGLLAEKKFKAGLIVLGILAAIVVGAVLMGFK
jgi:hypothetical protein